MSTKNSKRESGLRITVVNLSDKKDSTNDSVSFTLNQEEMNSTDKMMTRISNEHKQLKKKSERIESHK